MKIRLKKSSCEKLIKAIDDYIQKVDGDLKKALEDAGYADPKLTMDEIEKLEREIKKLLDADTKIIINEIYDYDSVEDFIVSRWPDVKNSKDLVEKLTTSVSMRLQEAIPEFVEEYISRTDPVLSYIGMTHETTAWIQSWSEDLANLMKLTDNNAIERILAGAVKNGLSVADTAKKIADSGIRDSGYRARRTATTELLRAHSVAQQESFMQSPAVVSKMWRHSGWRQYSRENHIDMDGQTVRKEEPFVLFAEDGNVYYPMYPRDQVLPAGETINCGCISQPIVDESLYEMSAEDRQRMQEAEINRLNAEYDQAHRNDPGSAVSFEGIPKSWGKPLHDINALAVNPKHYADNCVNCVYTYEMRKRGYSVVASQKIKRLSSDPFAGWIITDDTQLQSALPGTDAKKTIVDYMKSLDDGARVQVNVRWNLRKDGIYDNKGDVISGHSFIAENRRKKAVFIDVQNGREYSKDIDGVFKDANQFEVTYCRIDNLEPNDLGNTASMIEVKNHEV